MKRLLFSFGLPLLVLVGAFSVILPQKALAVECTDGTIATDEMLEQTGQTPEQACGGNGGVRGEAGIAGIEGGTAACQDHILGIFPTWYKYLEKKSEQPCEVGHTGEVDVGTRLNDGLLILMAVIELLTRAAVFLAVGWIIYGGIRYITSQGEPEALNGAKNTIINAVVGLVITVIATGIVTFIATRLAG